MKKVCSFKKKIVALGLAVCTFVSSTGVSECYAAGNAAQQNQNQQESWTVYGTIKWLLNRGVELSVLYVAYRLGLLTYILHHHESAGDILFYLSSLIGTGVVMNKIKSIPSNIKDEFSKNQKKRKELKEEEQKLKEELKEERKKLEEKFKEKLAKNNKESWNTLGEEFTLLPKKLVTAGATVASGAWTCATIGPKLASGAWTCATTCATIGPKLASGAWTCATIGAKLAAFCAKGAFYGAKGLYNLIDWLMTD